MLRNCCWQAVPILTPRPVTIGRFWTGDGQSPQGGGGAVAAARRLSVLRRAYVTEILRRRLRCYLQDSGQEYAGWKPGKGPGSQPIGASMSNLGSLS